MGLCGGQNFAQHMLKSPKSMRDSFKYIYALPKCSFYARFFWLIDINRGCYVHLVATDIKQDFEGRSDQSPGPPGC